MKKVFMTLAAVLMGMTAANAQLVLGGSLSFQSADKDGTYIQSLRTNSTSENGLIYKNANPFRFGFAPKIGYMLNDQKIEVGVKLELLYGQSTNYLIKYNKVEKELEGGLTEITYTDGKAVKKNMTSYLNFFVDPYARFRVVNAKGFGVWFEGLVRLGTSVDLKTKQYAYEKGYYKEGTQSMSYIEEKEALTQEMIDKKKELDPQKSFSNFTGSFRIAPVLTYDINEHWRLEAALNFLAVEVGGYVETTESYKNVLKKELGTEKSTANSVYYNLGIWTGNVANLGNFAIGAVYKF